MRRLLLAIPVAVLLSFALAGCSDKPDIPEGKQRRDPSEITPQAPPSDGIEPPAKGGEGG